MIRDRLIDFIRLHISAIADSARRAQASAILRVFGVRAAWHGSGDVSPVGYAANLHLDMACHNLGIQEQHEFGDAAHAVLPGTPEIRDGALWPNDPPCLGLDLDEQPGAKYPFRSIPSTTSCRPFEGSMGR